MPEIFRTRDCVVHSKGDAYSVKVVGELLNGWRGCQGVMWSDIPGEFAVTRSDGLYGGFLLWGSDEPSDAYTSISLQQPAYGYAILCAGGWLISTPVYEAYTLSSRMGGGALVPNVYTARERLVFSNRGLWTREDEWSIVGDPRGPNSYYVASVVQAPSVKNNWNLVLQTSI